MYKMSENTFTIYVLTVFAAKIWSYIEAVLIRIGFVLYIIFDEIVLIDICNFPL